MKIRLNYNNESWDAFQVDIKCYIENLSMHLGMMNRSVESVLRGKPSKDEIDKWIKALETWKNRALLWKELPDRIINKKDFELTKVEYLEFIRMIVHEIELSKARMEDYKTEGWSWAKEIMPHERKGLNRKIRLYEKLEGKKYKYSDEMYEKYSAL